MHNYTPKCYFIINSNRVTKIRTQTIDPMVSTTHYYICHTVSITIAPTTILSLKMQSMIILCCVPVTSNYAACYLVSMLLLKCVDIPKLFRNSISYETSQNNFHELQLRYSICTQTDCYNIEVPINKLTTALECVNELTVVLECLYINRLLYQDVCIKLFWIKVSVYKVLYTTYTIT